MTDKREAGLAALHGAIMNLPCKRALSQCATTHEARAYAEGYRDARHAAADMVNESAAQAEQTRVAGAAQGGITSLEGLTRYEAGYEGMLRNNISGEYVEFGEVKRLFAASALSAVPPVSAAEQPNGDLHEFARHYETLRAALHSITAPADAGCGCSFPCRCDTPEAEAINAESMRDEAFSALKATPEFPAHLARQSLAAPLDIAGLKVTRSQIICASGDAILQGYRPGDTEYDIALLTNLGALVAAPTLVSAPQAERAAVPEGEQVFELATPYFVWNASSWHQATEGTIGMPLLLEYTRAVIEKFAAPSSTEASAQPAPSDVGAIIEHAARICESHCACDNGEADEEINRMLRNRAAQIRDLARTTSTQPTSEKGGAA